MVYIAVAFSFLSILIAVCAFRSGKQSVYAEMSNDENEYMSEINKNNVLIRDLSAQLLDSKAYKEIAFYSCKDNNNALIEAVKKVNEK